MSRIPAWLAALALGLLCGAVPACGGDGGSSGGPGGDTTAGDTIAGDTAPGPPPTVHLNEVMPINNAVIQDAFDEFDDWVELYNPSDTTASLEGFYLSDDPANPLKFRLSADLRVPPRGVLLLWADDDEETQGPDHLSFGLAGPAEAVILSAPDGTEIERFEWQDAVPDQSYARFPDGTGPFAACAGATPGAVNGAACAP